MKISTMWILDVNFIAKQMGMSRASLYNKTKGMMDIGISEYIIKMPFGICP